MNERRSRPRLMDAFGRYVAVEEEAAALLARAVEQDRLLLRAFRGEEE